MLQFHYSESETQWTLPVDDDIFACGSTPSSPNLTSASQTASISQVTQELDTKSDRASDADKTSDEDAEDTVLFKGRCKY
ncbi:hypothetical protein BJX68DRAFT_77819 [Aspergillus pseudodeflectus]|uniref:Uncharacterized protein n=1 Tax=Aspergillus pseudodeflectus TaxID=176178 RepID=A0ABR4L686_9EURO